MTRPRGRASSPCLRNSALADEAAAARPLDGKLALITGASRGIGRAVARGLAEAGAHVIAVTLPRSTKALEELDDEIRAVGGTATLVPLDLRDGQAIDQLGASVAERWGRLDILIGNAGILGDLSPFAHLELKVWEDLIAVNLTANWRLIRAFDPLLRAAEAGRVIFLTSGAAAKDKPYWGGYAVTKAGLEKLAKTYAAEVAKTPVRVNLVNPGPMRTSMRAKAMPGENPATLPPPEELVPLFLEMAGPDYEGTGQVIDFQSWRTQHRL